MEDGLVRFDPTNVEFWDAEVLILVVVEDGLVLLFNMETTIISGLNPCCSGRWSRTS